MTASATTGRAPLGPLSPVELAAARAAAERLAVEVTRLLGAVEPAHRNAFALARFLKVDRTACQRLLSAVSTVDETTLVNAPGAKALSGLIDAMNRRAIDPSVVRGLEEAVAAMASVFSAMGGHQRGFAQRVYLTQQLGRVGGAPAPAVNPDEAPQRLFEAARELTGRWSDTQTQIAIIRPSASHDRTCDVARARGLIGHVQQPGAVPLVFTHLFARGEAEQKRYRELRPRATTRPPSSLAITVRRSGRSQASSTKRRSSSRSRRSPTPSACPATCCWGAVRSAPPPTRASTRRRCRRSGPASSIPRAA
ncbi:MAG: hypothetical protein QM783_18610 [Phycisphaerales bacterium]